MIVFVLSAIRMAGSSFDNGNPMQRKEPNNLIHQSSPYLLQHAHNPVNWFAWSDQAFEKALKEDKPIFVSIGYSTCHWCHVMEKESFDDERIAAILNEHFVSIKVDREQRPDLDSMYMTAVQAMTGQGGWPLNVFITPDGRPFYGGTYFPPNDMFKRPGFDKILLTIAEWWKNDRDKLLESADKISKVLSLTNPDKVSDISINSIESMVDNLKHSFDPKYGGFGAAPKFPQPGFLMVLLSHYKRTQDTQSLEMVEKTLQEMASGGIHDHLGGGFHRYSVDQKWLVPHFEKMLYDQALISRVYIEAYQVTKKKRYADVARHIFDYVLRDMTDADGGFYSAEDADSEGREGLFYVWKHEEIENILGSKAEAFNDYYNVTKQGNFEEQTNILNVTHWDKRIQESLSKNREKLFALRSKRSRPHRDDKIISAWNGLMISSMAYGGAALCEKHYIKAAERAANFILKNLKTGGRLMRFYRNGKSVEKGFLNDYAFMSLALLDLYEATFDPKWLIEAKTLTDHTIELFADTENGGFYLTGSDSEKLLVRSKPDYDAAVPSGNSIAALILLRLGRLTMNKELETLAEKTLRYFSGRLSDYPSSLGFMQRAVDFYIGPSQEIVIAQGTDQKQAEQMLKGIRETFLPNSITVYWDPENANSVIKHVPCLKNHKAIGGNTTVYICENYTCRKPVTDMEVLRKILLSLAR